MAGRLLPIRVLRRFIQTESSGGVILFIMAVLAILIENSALNYYYHLFFQLNISLGMGQWVLTKPLIVWINNFLMTIFFLVIGLEIKREFLEGELHGLSKAILPIIAALGGMAVPILIYVICNWTNPATLQGWAIPAATDIAFSLAILTILGSRIPPALKTFLLALSIFDDIGSIIIIAVFYTPSISVLMLLGAAFITAELVLLNRFNVTKLTPYWILGILLWIFLFRSRVHGTLTGVILGFIIPLRDRKHPQYSPLAKVEKALHPWVAYGILPLFVFANAGISLQAITWANLTSPVAVGITLGLFLGKQIGVFLISFLAIKLGIAKLPHGVSLLGLYGVAIVAGVGFTMSLYIGSLRLPHFYSYGIPIRVGILSGSFLSAIVGYMALRFIYRKPVAK